MNTNKKTTNKLFIPIFTATFDKSVLSLPPPKKNKLFLPETFTATSAKSVLSRTSTIKVATSKVQLFKELKLYNYVVFKLN